MIDNAGETISTAIKSPAADEAVTVTESGKASDLVKDQGTTIEPLITKAGGLGDTKETIEHLRGADENGQDASISFYQNNSFLAIYAEDDVTKKNTALNVTLSFEATDTPKRSVKEAIREASSVIPSDAVKVKEYKVDEERDVIHYESKLLSERLKGWYELDAANNPESVPGTFIVILNHDEEGIFSVVVGVGNNP
ncbi:hypothetical protein MF628_003274 [Paenibacillus polymyxa]|uniref:hypothetical protein n=1 Tax=Paenibacillus polymyxa TaxID=1406 RepID=UPI002023CD21|nr:hypothetical protein [Paenibacillus polymyxa]URJ43641.1 hypothetical protein MF628_003274 [Paenibacillus polymyxa]